MTKRKKTTIKSTDSEIIGNENKKLTSAHNISLFSTSLAYKSFLFACALILYAWTYSFDYGIDDKFITHSLNSIENTFDGFISVFKIWFAGADYRPISFLSFWLERNIFNESSASVSHLVNTILYACIAWNIFTFIQVSRFYDNPKKNEMLALICGLLFIIHPNHVSIVANIKARDNLLSMLFGLIAAIHMIKYIDYKKTYRIALFFLFNSIALLSKLDAYIFLIVPLFVLLFFREFDKKRFIRILALLILIFITTFIVFNILKSIPNKDEYIFSMGFDENPLVENDTFLNRISLALTSLFYYLKFLIYPKDYYFFYGYNQIPVQGFFSFINLSVLFTLIILFFAALKIYSKNKIYLFSLLFFLCSIAYALNIIVLVAGIVMDKYNFIASLGFCLALSAILIDFSAHYSLRIFKHPALLSIIIVFTALTVYRTKDWKNSFTLIENDMPSLSKSVNANRMAAAAYINLALDEEMKPGYNRKYTDSLIRKGEHYVNQGLLIYDKVPDLWELKGLSSFYYKDYKQAVQYFLKSKEVDSSYLSSINYIGYTYWALGNTDSAYYYFNYVINREPVFNYAANNLVNMLLQYNRKTELDSIMIVFHKKYPNDKWLQKRSVEIYGQ